MLRSLIPYALLLVTAQVRSQPDSGVLTGRLLSTEGRPVVGVRVAVLETTYPRLNMPSMVQTDAEGRFRLEDVPAGEYFLVADPFRSPSYYPGAGIRDESRLVTVTAGGLITNLDFTFVRASGLLRTQRRTGTTRFAGTLRDTKGIGVPNVVVSLLSTEANRRYWAVTDASGSFEFPVLRPGEFSLETFSPGRAGARKEELKVSLVLRENESLEQDFGLRVVGINSQQRPDLYVPPPPEAHLPGRTTSLDEERLWRFQKLDLQVQPQYPQNARIARIKGSVSLQVLVDSEGKLVSIRTTSADASPELARASVEAVAQWQFAPFRLIAGPLGVPMLTAGSVEGEPVHVQSTVTFNFLPD